MRVWALAIDAVREIYARKVIIGMIIIEVLALSLTAVGIFGEDSQMEYAEARRAGGRGADSASLAIGKEIDSARAADDSVLSEFGDDSTIVEESVVSDSSRSEVLESVAPVDSSHAHQSPGSHDAVLREAVKSELEGFAITTVMLTILLGIFATAGIVPSMMEKGTIDLLLSKPLPRWKLLWGRAAGGALAIGVNILLYSIATWAIYGSASGIWFTPYIWLNFLYAFGMFIVLYTAVIALNVVTESWVLPVSVVYFHTAILGNFLASRDETINAWISSPFVHTLVEGLYNILPQTSDAVMHAGQSVLVEGVFNWSPFIQGAIFSAAMIAFATWRFSRRDF